MATFRSCLSHTKESCQLCRWKLLRRVKVHKLSSPCSITHSHVVSSFHIGWIHCLSAFPPPRAQCDFFPPALTVTPSRERAAEKGYLSTEAFQYSLSSRACVPVCVCTVSASVLEEQGHRELMQRDEAKFSSLQYLSAQARERHLLYFHTRPLPQRARGRCSGRMCIKWCLPIQQFCAVLEVLFIYFFKMIRLDRKSAPQRGKRGLNVQWKECISSTLLPEPNSSTVMWANGLTHLK